jgi:hypothetical protein
LPESLGHIKGNAKRKFIAMSVFLKESERSEVSNLTMHLKFLRKKKKRTKQPQISRWKEIIKIRGEMN